MSTPPSSRRSWAIRTVSSLFRRQQASRLRRKRQDQVEALEDRALLATFTVTNVNDAGAGSLRAAIDSANATAAADDIVFDIPAVDPVITLTSDQYAIEEELIIDGENLGGGGTVTINGANNFRLFDLTDAVGIPVSFQNLTMIGGQATFDTVTPNTGRGGAIFSIGANVTVTEVLFAGNHGDVDGGAIYSNTGSLDVARSTFSMNTSGLDGGAITAETTPTNIFDSQFVSNQAGRDGGAIFNGVGGAAAQMAILRTAVTDNVAVRDGGGLMNRGTAASIDSLWARNDAEDGGAIYNEFFVEVINSTISGNTVSELLGNASGGGILNDNTVTITNSTISQNSAERGGGIYNVIAAGREVVMFNSLVAGNVDDTMQPNDVRGRNFDAGSSNNLIADPQFAGGLMDGVGGNIIGDGTGAQLDPSEVIVTSLTDNGGPTQTHKLLRGSVAHNTGDNNRAAFGGVDRIPDVLGGDVELTVDQRGSAPFVRIYEETVDIGAFEIQPLVVDLSRDESDGNFTAGDFSLREAIELANLSEGDDAIAFAIPEVDPIITIDEQLYIDSEITINGVNNTPEGGFVTIDGDNDGRLIWIDGLTPVDNGLPRPVVIFENLSFDNGNANGSDADVADLDGNSLDTDGGAILNQFGVVEIFNSGFFNNSADGAGGAILNTDGGTVSVVNTTIGEGEAATFGGAISNANGDVSIVNATITSNVTGISGGGIHTASGGSRTFVNNSIIAGNLLGSSAQDFGGEFVEPGGANNIVGSSASPGGLTHAVDGNIVGNDGLGTLDVSTVLNTTAENNGGPSLTYATVPAGLAIDAGDSNLAVRPGADLIPDLSAGDEALVSDTRTFPFERAFGVTVDIGAYEDQTLTTFVSTTEEDLDSDFSVGDFSIREALRFSNLNPNVDSIRFDLLGAAPNIDIEEQLVVTRSVIIDGSNMSGGNVTLDGDDTNRIMLIDGTVRPINAQISNIGFTGGNADGSDGGLSPESGGAILSRSATVGLTSVTFDSNFAADSGGAFYNEDGTLSLEDVTVRNNTARLLGGGIANDDGSVDIVTSTFSGNQASANGGAIFNNNGPLSIVNSTVSGNSANIDAGGIYNEDDTVVVVNSTIVSNIADADNNGTGTGGGLFTVDDGVTFTHTFNSIYAGNQVGTTAGDLGGKTPEAISSHNLVGDAASSAGLVDGTNGNIVGVSGAGTIALDAILDPTLKNNGGPVDTHSLAVGSPAVDSGDSNRAAVPGADNIPDVASGDTALVQDQRGFPYTRVFDAVDIGSYEVTQRWLVDTDSDVDNGVFTAGDLSLREAIGLANATPAEVTIEFDLPTANPVILVGDQFVVSSNVVIDGANQNAAGGNVILDGEGVGRILMVDAILNPATVGLTNITLTNGFADGSDPAPFNLEGGAIFNQSGDLWVSNSTISGSSATENGGGIMTRSGTATIWESTFSANTADNGAGLFSFGTTTTITDSTFSSNNALTAGGAVLTRTGQLSLISSTINNNTAATGAALANEINGNTHITNSTISGNRADSNAGGLENESGFLVLTNSTVAGNLADADSDGLGLGGGIWTAPIAGTRLFNTIVAGNEVPDVVNAGLRLPSDLGGADVIATSANNLIGDTFSSGGLTDGSNNNIVGNAGVGTIDITTVLDLTLAANGGSKTLTHALVPGSPAIDAGDSNRAALPGSDGLPNISADGDEALLFDQRDTPYVRTTGNVDIGSYEVTNDWIVSSLGDVDDGTFGPGSYTLREAINAANLNPGADTLTFDISLAQSTIDLDGTQFTISDNLTIRGLGASSLSIDAGGMSRIFHIEPTVDVEIEHVTLTGGSTAGDGGAILNEGTLAVRDAILTDNSGNQGGAIMTLGTLDVRRSLLTDNVAVVGGAISSDASQLNSYLENVTVSGNTATGVNGTLAGAGLHISDASFTVINSTIANNTSTAGGEGAGIAVDVAGSGSLRLINSIVADNITTSPSVDVAGELRVSHSLIEENSGYLILGDDIGNLNGDPELGPLQINHGLMPTHQLASSSPAIDAGDDTEVSFTTDQTGQPRQVRSVDMGAAELLLVANDDFTSTLITNSINIDVTNNDNPLSDAEVRGLVTDPTRGTATLNATSIDYTPDSSLTPGEERFEYELGLATQKNEGLPDAQLGYSVAVDGDWMVSGAWKDSSQAPASGGASIYRRSGANWVLFQQISADDGEALDQFGYSVGIDGTTIVVGARKSDALGFNSGAAYVFEFDASQNQWLQSAKLLDDSTVSSGDQFGQSVAIQGDTIVVGARFDDGFGRNSGSIYVFNRTSTGWLTDGRIKGTDARKGDQFGYSVAIDGGTIAVGARKDNDQGTDSGSVYILESNGGGTWTETTEIYSSNARKHNWLGHSVDISGDTVVIGKPQRFSRFRTGEVVVASRDAGGADNWGEVALIVDPGVDTDTDRFGISVSVDGDNLLIGKERDDSIADDTGKVYLHTRNTGGADAWGLESEFLAADARKDDHFGHAVAIDGSTMAIGAHLDHPTGNGNAGGTGNGAVYIEDLRTETAEVSVFISAPLLATEAGSSASEVLSEDQLAPIADAARAYWQATSLTPSQQAALANANISVASLDGLLLGTADSANVVLDSDAAGHSWYVDPTPFDQTDDNIGSQMDLLSVMTHELGHVIGLKDTYDPANADDMMYGYLEAGESRLNDDATSLDLVFGQLSEEDSLFAL
ncbi:MAG: choice-of-anchor Q domain-containing protein [Planctomycetaceae bacterium]